MTYIDGLNPKKGKFYREYCNTGAQAYNPQITTYYNSSNQAVMITEEWRGEVWQQTISGTGITSSGISYSIIESPWSKVTEVFTPWSLPTSTSNDEPHVPLTNI